ncbi:MAG: hypothetical protein WCZ23_00680 [Rhodospirillaceae bacterium]
MAGRLFPIKDAAGAVQAVVACARDITSEHQSLLRAEASEHRLKLILDVSELGTWEHDLENDLLQADRWARALYGVEHDDPVTPADILARVHPDDIRASPRPVKEPSIQ